MVTRFWSQCQKIRQSSSINISVVSGSVSRCTAADFARTTFSPFQRAKTSEGSPPSFAASRSASSLLLIAYGILPNSSDAVMGAGFKAEKENMNNIVGLAIFALGIVLLIFGFNESHSFNSDVSRFFTGNPTDRSIWMIAGGAAAVVIGLVMAIRGARKS